MSTANEPTPASAPPADPSTIGKPATSARIWTIAIIVGFLAGGIAWAAGETTLATEGWYENKKENVHVTLASIGIRNGMTSFGALGAAMGAAMGLAGGLIGRSALRASLAAIVGLLLGGGGGAALSWFILPVYYEHSANGDLMYSLMVHCGIWGALGAAAGLAFGLGMGRWRDLITQLILCAVAALLAAIVYEFVGGLLFQQALTDRPISQSSVSRLVARLLVTVAVAAGAAVGTQMTGTRKAGGGPQS